MKKNWDNYKERVAKKRGRKGEEKGAAPSGLTGITVQRLSSNVEGKCQKYSRIGPLTFVPLEKEATLENMKAACKAHFGTDLDCDLLAGERGPSYTDVNQIENWKVLHVRFVEGLPASANKRPLESRGHQSEPTRDSPRKNESCPRVAKSVKSSVVPSVSLSQMLKLGKVIVPQTDVVTLQLEEFSIANMEWLEPFEVTISLQRKPFAHGAFREAFLAKDIAGLPKGKYVLKKYMEKEVKGIEDLFGTIEAHTRKSVQLNALARNFAQNMDLEAQCFEFGQTFSYSKVYFSSLNKEYVTLENFMEGTFTKFINNTGEICVEPEHVNEISLKAEAFVHFTYVRSHEQLMVTDIQGVDYKLCDPEIATSQLTDPADSSIFFCTGNLSKDAIKNFLTAHNCNKYCELLHLSECRYQRNNAR